jgi:hypothetical protein
MMSVGEDLVLREARRTGLLSGQHTTLIAMFEGHLCENTMALITSLDRVSKPARRHDPVECSYDVITLGNEILLQLDTYGRKTRRFPGKVSQSIQLNRAAAEQLRAIIDSVFPK